MRKKIWELPLLAALVILSGCAPKYNVGLMHSSKTFQLEYVNKNCTNKDKKSVREVLGPPSFANESDTKWYYVGTQVLNRPFFPKIEGQKVTQIEFSEKGIVQNVEVSSPIPRAIKPLKNQTPTRLKQVPIMSKIFRLKMKKSKRKMPEKKTLDFY